MPFDSLTDPDYSLAEIVKRLPLPSRDEQIALYQERRKAAADIIRQETRQLLPWSLIVY